MKCIPSNTVVSIVLSCVLSFLSLPFCASGQAVGLSVPLSSVPSVFAQGGNQICNSLKGNSASDFAPTFAVNTAGVWIGTCIDHGGLVTLNTDGTFSSLPASLASHGTQFQFAADSTDANPIVVPLNSPSNPSGDAGKLQLNPPQWQSFGNDSACITTKPQSSVLLAYSAASDTFYSSTSHCPATEMRMRRASAATDQRLDTYCLPDPNYRCSAWTVWNDGSADSLFALAQPNNNYQPAQLMRQTLYQGGPFTNTTVVGTSPKVICYSSQHIVRMHPNGKMLFGGCGEAGLFYVDISDPSPTKVPSVQFVSTCTSVDGDLDNSLVVTHDRVYVTCQQGQASTFRAYPLSIRANGTVTLSDSNYIDISPSSCVVMRHTVMPSAVSGRPDALWASCQSGTLLTNVCGFGNSLTLATARDTYLCTPCGDHTFQSSYAFSTDQTCAGCASGSYYASSNALNCTLCAAGSYQPSTAASTCQLCESGKYQNATGASSCVTCELPNTATSSNGASSSSQCIQEICEIPGANPLYCKSVTSGVAHTQPLLNLLAILASLFQLLLS